MKDGRNIDAALGTLAGEGSVQRSHKTPAKREVYELVPSRPEEGWEDPAYYNVPMLRQTVWTPDIPAYYYVGGTAGASAVLGAAALLLGNGRYQRVTAASRQIAVAGSAVSAALLIHDLGRPERFLYMLRVFRPTSPMNMGSWILTGFGGAASGALALALLGRETGSFGRLLHAQMGLFGLMLSGYTGVLVSNTAVPVWGGARRTLPVLFTASAGAAAASLFHLLPLSEQESHLVSRFGQAAKAAELAATFAYEQELGNARVREPLRKGTSGGLWTAARVLTAASLVLSLFGSRKSKAVRVMTGVLGTAGSIALRFAVHEAGKASIRDSRASFHQQRDRHAGIAAAD